MATYGFFKASLLKGNGYDDSAAGCRIRVSGKRRPDAAAVTLEHDPGDRQRQAEAAAPLVERRSRCAGGSLDDPPRAQSPRAPPEAVPAIFRRSADHHGFRPAARAARPSRSAVKAAPSRCASPWTHAPCAAPRTCKLNVAILRLMHILGHLASILKKSAGWSTDRRGAGLELAELADLADQHRHVPAATSRPPRSSRRWRSLSSASPSADIRR